LSKLLVGVELVHREDEVLAAKARLFGSRQHNDGVCRADLDAELTDYASVEVQSEIVAVPPLFSGDGALFTTAGLDADHVRWADLLAHLAADTGLFALWIMDEREGGAIALSTLSRFLPRKGFGDFFPEEISQSDTEGIYGRNQAHATPQ